GPSQTPGIRYERVKCLHLQVRQTKRRHLRRLQEGTRLHTSQFLNPTIRVEMARESIPKRRRQKGASRLDPEQVHKRLPGSDRGKQQPSSTVRTHRASKRRQLHYTYWTMTN